MCEESCAHPLILSAHVAYDRALVRGHPGQRALSPPKMEKKSYRVLKSLFLVLQKVQAHGGSEGHLGIGRTPAMCVWMWSP